MNIIKIYKIGILIIYIYAMFLFPQLVQSEDNVFLLGQKYGLSGYYNYNMQAADMRQLPSMPDSVPRSANGISQGITLGTFYEYRLTERTSILFRGLYSYHPAEISGNSLDSLLYNNEPVLGVVNNAISSDLSNFKMEASVKYRFLGEFGIIAGLNGGFRFDNKADHIQFPFSPSGATFPDGSTHREGLDKLRSKIGLQAALIVGFSYDIPISYKGHYLIVPEVVFETGFSHISTDFIWDVNTFRAGISLKYSESPTRVPIVNERYASKQLIETVNIAKHDIKNEYISKGSEFVTYDTLSHEYEIVITRIENRVDTLFYPLKATIEEAKVTKQSTTKAEVNGCMELNDLGWDGTSEHSKYRIEVEEFLSTSMQPMLNYIFFEENSAIIPSRYIQYQKDYEVAGFEIEKLRNSSIMQNYYQILNIVGRRLIEYPDSKITLTGCNSGSDLEQGNSALSENRAISVKDYLTVKWGIENERIAIRSRTLPEKPSNINDPDGAEENRRVEISSEDKHITSPLIIKDTMRVTNMPQVRFYSRANECYKISNWALSVKQGEYPLIGFKGEQAMPERIIWRLEEASQTIPRFSIPLTYKLSVRDISDNVFESDIDSIEVYVKSIERKNISDDGDKRVDRYSLILFDYDKSDISGQNASILSMINDRIQKDSKVIIHGYTDRVGNDDYNLQLSRRRAANTASAIRNSTEVHFEGLGERELIYNNELPEGRFYCRTVIITVETPIE